MRTFLLPHPHFGTSARLRRARLSATRIAGFALLVLGLLLSGPLLAGIARGLTTLASDVVRVLDEGINGSLRGPLSIHRL